MGGVHFVFRKSKKGNLYNAVSSDFTPGKALAYLPKDINGNDETDKNAVPEFFHVFYKSPYTLDVGVAYMNNNEYQLFANVNGTWTPGPKGVATVKKVLKSWFIKEGDYRYVMTQFGDITHKVKITTAMYNSLNGGCEIYREMVIASNENSVLPARAYYTNAKFDNTSLTKVAGGYDPLDSTATVFRNKLDSNVTQGDFDRYCASKYSVSGSTFIADVSSATFNSMTYPIG